MIQEKRAKFEAYKVMTDMIADIQKLQENKEDNLTEDDEEKSEIPPLETTSEADLQYFDKWAKKQAQNSLESMSH